MLTTILNNNTTIPTYSFDMNFSPTSGDIILTIISDREEPISVLQKLQKAAVVDGETAQVASIKVFDDKTNITYLDFTENAIISGAFISWRSTQDLVEETSYEMIENPKGVNIQFKFV